jgi:two-component system LytT family response regulator
MNSIRTALVDDEPLAREGLRTLLAAQQDLEIVGEYGSGTAFLRDAARLRPDLVFLDVEMPRLSGLDVLEHLHATGAQPYVVFVTAYEHYAVRAFEEEAIDYVLKPYHADRLEKTLARIRQQISARNEENAESAEGADFLRRVAVKSGSRIHLVRIDEVDWIEAAENYVRLHTGAQAHLYRTTMAAIEPRLDPARFVRIHRSTIVNVDRIAELQTSFGRELVVLLTDGTRLKLSAQYRERLRSLVTGL